MRYSLHLIFLLCLLLFSVCEWPFNTQPTLEGPIFKVTAQLSQRYFIDSAFVNLAWPPVGYDNFTSLKIIRRYVHPPDTLSDDWELRAVITNPYVNTWKDTIYDDEDLRYQVTVYQVEGPYGSSEVDVMVPPVTRLTVPTESTTIKQAVESRVVDNGDTVLVLPGEYFTRPVDFQRKKIHLLSSHGAASTTLIRSPSGTTAWSNEPLITMSGGSLRGFTITHGIAARGSGVYAGGTSVIRHCILRENVASAAWPQAGLGGALYLTDSVHIENCILYNNSSSHEGAGIYIDVDAEDVRVVNSTIQGNAAGVKGGGIALQVGGIDSLGGTVTIENCIVVNNGRGGNIYPPPHYAWVPCVIYSNAGEGWPDVNSTNIADDPLFADPTMGDFNLQPGSPCIDAGNPDPDFNDTDGSRNDMGAFGGPCGAWEAPGSQVYNLSIFPPWKIRLKKSDRGWRRGASSDP
ncbi:MAG: right-handed parallel beta-helix repeat-containing protein [Candidatus Neomarinimicrobiota bacterium]